MNEFKLGKPGLILLIMGKFFTWLSHLDQGTYTFVLGSVATFLAILYYLIQIFKSFKKK